jgi:rhodanese-related sulfurtransferase
MVTTITPAELLALRKRGEAANVIDVRTPAEFGEVHVDFARNVPLDRLDPATIVADHGGRSEPIYFVCRSGGRSKSACEKMIAAGISNVVSVEGGTSACDAAGLPVVRGKKAMSLERQVRIAAGALVATGAALAAFGPDPIWQNVGAGLAGFVGCGLVFAGVTDTCGMAMLISRMPWNQVAASTCTRVVAAIMMTVAMAGTTVAAGHTKDPLPAVRTAIESGQAVIIDVREPDEWAEGHLAAARLLPLSSLENGVNPADLARVLPKNKVIYCHCLVGGRCLEAATILRPLGYDIRPLAQGYPDLVRAGFPTVTGK